MGVEGEEWEWLNGTGDSECFSTAIVASQLRFPPSSTRPGQNAGDPRKTVAAPRRWCWEWSMGWCSDLERFADVPERFGALPTLSPIADAANLVDARGAQWAARAQRTSRARRTCTHGKMSDKRLRCNDTWWHALAFRHECPGGRGPMWRSAVAGYFHRVVKERPSLSWCLTARGHPAPRQSQTAHWDLIRWPNGSTRVGASLSKDWAAW